MDKKIELKTETGMVKNPQKVAEMLNVYFVETVDEIINKITTLQMLTQLSQRLSIVPTQYSCYVLLKMK